MNTVSSEKQIINGIYCILQFLKSELLADKSSLHLQFNIALHYKPENQIPLSTGGAEDVGLEEVPWLI